MQSITEEEDDVPTVATKSQPQGELEASEEVVPEESNHDDELKASDEVVPEELRHEESKASEEAVAEEFEVSDEVVVDESKPEEEFKASGEAVSEESKPEEEFKASDEAVSEESKPEEEFKASDEAVSEESKPEEEFKASDEAVSEESKPEEEFKASDKTVSEESKPEEEFKASDEAVSFLTSIEPKELEKCVFSESLMVVSNSGAVVGEFNLSVEFTHRGLEPCVILHAQSQGAIDGSPCGTSVTTYLTTDLEVLEEDYNEYVKLDSYDAEKRSHMVQRGEQMVINKSITMGEDVTEEECLTYPMSGLRGLITEGSSLLLMRLMALRKTVPENMVFIILDQSLHIVQTTFSELDMKKMPTPGFPSSPGVFGLERIIGSSDADHSTWHCYFLDNGYLASRTQVDSPVNMRFIQEVPKKGKVSGRMKIPLEWQEDMQLYSLYLDKKDFLKAEHNSYLREHPELRALLSDFIQDLLIVKPDNIFQFAREYFPPYSTYHSPESDLKTPSPETL